MTAPDRRIVAVVVTFNRLDLLRRLVAALVETDGLVELGEAVTSVEPGQTVGFLAYANLM